MLNDLGGALNYPEVIPRALGLDLYKLFDADPTNAGALKDVLVLSPGRNAEEELVLLRAALSPKKQSPKTSGRSMSKTSLRMGLP